VLLGAAAFWLKDALSPPSLPLDIALARLRVSSGSVRDRPIDGAERAVRRAGESLGLPARIEAKYRTDLRLVGQTVEEHLARRFVGFAVGVLAIPTLTGLAFAVGTSVPFLPPVWVSPALGIAGFLQPGRSLAIRAAVRRESLRYALISFLYSAASSMKSGDAREDAVEKAANAGEGWAFAELRAAHWDAWALSEDISVHVDRLGRELGNDDLRAVAATLAAGGESGARIADALVAKARSMQDSVLSATKARSAKAGEDMDAWLVLLVMMPIVAFLVLPAVSGVQGL
jgi:tight adherence protein C